MIIATATTRSAVRVSVQVSMAGISKQIQDKESRSTIGKERASLTCVSYERDHDSISFFLFLPPFSEDERPSRGRIAVLIPTRPADAALALGSFNFRGENEHGCSRKRFPRLPTKLHQDLRSSIRSSIRMNARRAAKGGTCRLAREASLANGVSEEASNFPSPILLLHQSYRGTRNRR